MEDKLVVFRDRHGRGPTRWERAALTREAAVDTRTHKSGAGSADLRRRWLVETAEHGWTPRCLVDALADADHQKTWTEGDRRSDRGPAVGGRTASACHPLG
ncbi:MAG: hypothetical protein WKF58_18000 [Ilumatobacteraceae bacterium]